MGNVIIDPVESLSKTGYSHSEFEVAKSTILLMDEKGYINHYFNWHLKEETITKLRKHGVMVKCGSDHSGLFTCVTWK